MMFDIIKDKKLFLFDVDGTISLSGKAFPFTKSVFDALKRNGKAAAIMTNNSSKTPNQYRLSLNSYGLGSDVGIITSLDIALNYLNSIGINKMYWAANRQVSEYIKESGFVFDAIGPDCLLLTFDTELNYSKLLDITRLIHANVPYYVTHRDFVCPTDLGYPIPDVGSFMELIKTAAGKYPDMSFGKPEPLGILHYIHSMGFDPKDTIMFGDRLYTDIQFAINANITSALVLSGETDMEAYEKSHIKADIVINNIGVIQDVFE